MLTTRQKVSIARALSFSALGVRRVLGRPSQVTVTRHGIRWSLDLKEGIDLAIYLLGGFEVRTLRKYPALVGEGETALDIGANIGAHTLPLAHLVGATGKVYSFEPTAYAFAKQQANIALNPGLASRIHAEQMMLTSVDAGGLPESVYSSWPLAGASDLHDQHRGRLMSTHGSRSGTLDAFLAERAIPKVDFIKLDVDGNEHEVLKGAEALLRASGPKIVLELAPGVYREKMGEFDELLDGLWHLGYELSDLVVGQPLPRNATALRKLIPEGAGLNALAQRRR